MKNIPISLLKKISKEFGYDHIIMFCTVGTVQYIATFGNNIEQCDQAAQFGNRLKDALGWPESLHALPPRVKNLIKRVHELEKILVLHGIDPNKSITEETKKDPS